MKVKRIREKKAREFYTFCFDGTVEQALEFSKKTEIPVTIHYGLGSYREIFIATKDRTMERIHEGDMVLYSPGRTSAYIKQGPKGPFDGNVFFKEIFEEESYEYLGEEEI